MRMGGRSAARPSDLNIEVLRTRKIIAISILETEVLKVAAVRPEKQDLVRNVYE
jgi:hypothetical protein